MRSRRRVASAAEPPVFSALKLFSRTIVRAGPHARPRLRPDAFESLTDSMAIVRPHARFGEFRFEFFGSTFAETTPRGDLLGVAFHELLDCPYYRASLAGFRHVHHTGLPHVTRNFPIIGGGAAYYTRLLIPVFADNRLALILCTATLHDEPLPEGHST